MFNHGSAAQDRIRLRGEFISLFSLRAPVWAVYSLAADFSFLAPFAFLTTLGLIILTPIYLREMLMFPVQSWVLNHSEHIVQILLSLPFIGLIPDAAHAEDMRCLLIGPCSSLAVMTLCGLVEYKITRFVICCVELLTWLVLFIHTTVHDDVPMQEGFEYVVRKSEADGYSWAALGACDMLLSLVFLHSRMFYLRRQRARSSYHALVEIEPLENDGVCVQPEQIGAPHISTLKIKCTDNLRQKDIAANAEEFAIDASRIFERPSHNEACDSDEDPWLKAAGGLECVVEKDDDLHSWGSQETYYSTRSLYERVFDTPNGAWESVSHFMKEALTALLGKRSKNVDLYMWYYGGRARIPYWLMPAVLVDAAFGPQRRDTASNPTSPETDALPVPCVDVFHFQIVMKYCRAPFPVGTTLPPRARGLIAQFVGQVPTLGPAKRRHAREVPD